MSSIKAKPFEEIMPSPIPDIWVVIVSFTLSNISIFSFNMDISAPVSTNSVINLPVLSFLIFTNMLRLRLMVFIEPFIGSEHLRGSVGFPSYLELLGHYLYCYCSGFGSHLGLNCFYPGCHLGNFL